MTQSTYSTTPPLPQSLTRYYVKMTKPTLTRILIGINIVVFIAMLGFGLYVLQWSGSSVLDRITSGLADIIALLLGNKYPETDYTLLIMGAKYNQLILQGQVWRLFTAMFLHIGIVHLGFNLVALNMLGQMVEGYFGHWRFAIIYVIGGLFGSLASYAFSANPSAGASGAVFGLAGAITIYFLKYRNNFGEQGKSVLQSMFAIIGINLVFGLATSGIDNWGHIGGLIGGAIVAFGFLPNYEQPNPYAPAATPQPNTIQPINTAPNETQPSSQISQLALPEKRNRNWELIWSAVMVAAVWAVLQMANGITPI